MVPISTRRGGISYDKTIPKSYLKIIANNLSYLPLLVTIHVPLPKNYGTTREQSSAPAAIAHEAPEGTYLFPVTEQKKETPPAINLVLNLRLVMDGGNNVTNLRKIYSLPSLLRRSLLYAVILMECVTSLKGICTGG